MALVLSHKIEDLEAILHDSPWNIRGTLLVLRRRIPFMAVSQVELSTIDLWVWLHFVPIELFDHDAIQLGYAIGSLLGVDWSILRQQRKDYFCVFVRLRLDDLSSRGSSMSMVENFFSTDSNLLFTMPDAQAISTRSVGAGAPEELGSFKFIWIVDILSVVGFRALLNLCLSWLLLLAGGWWPVNGRGDPYSCIDWLLLPYFLH
ncbi:hypothetical protein RJ640_004082 [Escallonia rubra]|uniref:DUF4283 domain-containing protein n=1 Tax=Escallonia rubra TaxID=112253 RepID=A0AA88QS62_9ASTE|nr:hypothetical protein RJ640_004082 [Escallonia rubra]